MNPVETYLQRVSEIHRPGIGVPETSYYPALVDLLDTVGQGLDPKVRCVAHPGNRGAGLPDLGLFTAGQLRGASPSTAFGEPPERGVVEVKPPALALDDIARSEQVRRYLDHYGQVLVTNLRGFLLVGRQTDGSPDLLERYELAGTADAFWSAAALSRATDRQHGARLVEFLRRAMLSSARLSRPRDVAWLLASYAREARTRIEGVELRALDAIRSGLEETIGVRFSGARGEHLFRSTLVQTLFYGVFSAWVLWTRRAGDSERFDWRDSAWHSSIPMISALFYQISAPSHLRPLRLDELLDWAGQMLNRVDRASFLATFEEGEEAVQYFYEPFLQAFDPELRKEHGVWYTPGEVVRYMVDRVDTVLREELGLAEGLADERVIVLDPACGTGSFLIEVLKRIAVRQQQRGADALAGQDLKQAAMHRVYGFEVLPAPFVVAHLQAGLLLEALGAPLRAGDERAAIYLTNALTGWTEGTEHRQRALIREFEEERDAAEHVKQHERILVVIGNPPYNGYAGLALDQERGLVEAYRAARDTRQPQGQGLNDLYVRFFRMAERKIVEGTGRGVVCYISNYSWLDGLSHPAMRERYLDAFDRIWIDNLNGDKYKTGKLTPEGQPDPSVFSTDWNREGIQVGAAITLMVRKDEHAPADRVLYRDLWGRTKRADLLATSIQTDDALYQEVRPAPELGLPFTPLRSSSDYLTWPTLPELFPVSFPGVTTSRDDVVVDIDRDRLEARMRHYFDPSLSNEEIRRLMPGVMATTSGFNPQQVRAYLMQRGFKPENIVRYCYRPFDIRWLYWESETKLLDRPRADYFHHVFMENVFLFTTGRTRKAVIEPSFTTPFLSDYNCLDSGARGFPMYLRSSQTEMFRVADSQIASVNAAPVASEFLARMGLTEPDLFLHALAVTHSIAYRDENTGALRHDWPRIPLPASADRLRHSAALGEQVAGLLDPLWAVAGVTSGDIRPELRAIGAIQRVGGGNLDPGAGDLAVTARWGIAGRGGITMPSTGKAVARPYTDAERAAIAAGAEALGLSADQAFACLGETTYDIYLNERAYWGNVPARVWSYTIGGYQVIKKWLSYRESALLGRPLSSDEAREVTQIARRIAAILLLEPALDANYQAVKAATYDWPG